MKNPLTTIFGFLAAIGAAVAHFVPGVAGEIGTYVTIAATALLGANSTDSGTGTN